MAFQPINFSNIQGQGNPVMRDLVPNLMRSIQMGMQLRQIPEQMRRQAEQEQIANQMNQARLEEVKQAQQDARDPSAKARRTLGEYVKMKSQQGPMSEQDMLGIKMFKQANNIPDTPAEVQAKKDAAFKEWAQKEDYTNKNKQHDFVGRRASEEDAKIAAEDRRQAFELKKIEKQLQNNIALERFKSSLKPNKEDSDGLSIESSVKSGMQKNIATIDRLIPLISKLRDINTPLKGVSALNMKAKREYDSTLAEAAEAFMKAKDLPSTNESLKMVKEEIFAKRYGETNEDYKERIEGVINSLKDIRSYNVDSLKSKKIHEQYVPKSDKNTLSELPKGAVVVEFVQGPNGKWGRK